MTGSAAFPFGHGALEGEVLETGLFVCGSLNFLDEHTGCLHCHSRVRSVYPADALEKGYHRRPPSPDGSADLHDDLLCGLPVFDLLLLQAADQLT